MYSIKIRNHIMIAHSFHHELFGPAQNLHGATFIVDVTFYSKKLSQQNVVIDISLAHEILQKVLEPLHYRNLDELPRFKDVLTTSEFLCKHIHDRLKMQLSGFFSGKIQVVLGESHIAWAAYEGEME
jgi:6-pyruvoyltetrahydropterin/6-carboxytetrahydropterin synthase